MIDFKYTILEVKPELDYMRVLFEATGKKPIEVGTHIPREGVDLAQHLRHYAPFGEWERMEAKLATVHAGTTGTYTAQQQEAASSDANLLAASLFEVDQASLVELSLKNVVLKVLADVERDTV